MNAFLPNVSFFCIHLTRAIEREAFLTHFQNQLGRPIICWTASEGSDVAALGWPRGHPHERETSLGALGCVDSHLRLLQKMVEENLECIGIFEDDAELMVPVPQLQEFYERACKEAPTWDILILGANEYVDLRKCDESLVQPLRYWGTHAFLIRQNAAKKVLELFYELQKRGYTYPADWLYSAAISMKGLLAVGPSVCRSLIRQKPGLISAINGKVRT